MELSYFLFEFVLVFYDLASFLEFFWWILICTCKFLDFLCFFLALLVLVSSLMGWQCGVCCGMARKLDLFLSFDHFYIKNVWE